MSIRTDVSNITGGVSEIVHIYTAEDVKRIDMDIVMVVDCSGSMEGPKHRLVLGCLHALTNLCARSTRIGIIRFDHEATIVQPLETIDKIEMKALERKLSPWGKTNFAAGMQLGMKMFQNEHLHVRQRLLFILTDGAVNVGNPAEIIMEFKQLMKSQKSIVTCCYGFGNDAEHFLIDKLGQVTGDVITHFYSDDMIEDLLKELSSMVNIASNIAVSWGMNGDDILFISSLQQTSPVIKIIPSGEEFWINGQPRRELSGSLDYIPTVLSNQGYIYSAAQECLKHSDLDDDCFTTALEITTKYPVDEQPDDPMLTRGLSVIRNYLNFVLSKPSLNSLYAKSGVENSQAAVLKDEEKSLQDTI